MSQGVCWTTNRDLQALAGAIGLGLGGTTAPAPQRDAWLPVMTLALEHGVGGLLHRSVSRGLVPSFAGANAAILARHGAANETVNRALLHELRRLCGVLSYAGIDTIPLKGVSLCQRLYGDLSSRVSRDIDFLVPEEAREAALRALAQDGYVMRPPLPPRQLAAKARYAGQFLMHRAGSPFAIEPHWALAPRNLALRLDHRAMWQRRRPPTDASLGLPTLAPEDEFIMLCIHGFKEEWSRLKLIADLAQLVTVHPALEWDAVAARARAQRVWWAVLVGVSLVSTVFGVGCPLTGAAQATRAPERVAKQALAAITDAAETRRKVPLEASIYRVSALRRRMRERRLDRMRYVWRTVVTPREAHFQAFPLPDRLFPAYVGVKLLHDYVALPGWRAVKWARRAPAPKSTPPPAPIPKRERTKVLILTPVKDAAQFLDRFFANLAALDTRGIELSIGMLESDSLDGTFEEARRRLDAMGSFFTRKGLWRRPFGYRLPPGVPRWAPEHQYARRSVLARSRNHLLSRALDDEDWVLWLDVDVVEYPRDLIQRLIATGKQIVQPHCVVRYGGPTFDSNAWAGIPARTMDAMRDEGDLVPLDSVGGTCLLVAADLHRDGLVFPPFLYGRAHAVARDPGPWAPQRPGEIETEGFGLMALDMGSRCWGLPNFEILHGNH